MWSSPVTWFSSQSSGSGEATSIADGATLEGQLIVPSGADIVIQEGGHLSLPSQNRVGGAIAAPSIRSGEINDNGIAADATSDQLSMIRGGVPSAGVAHEALATQAIAAAGNTITHGSYAPVTTKTISNNTAGPITLTSNPNIEDGLVDGQILILRWGGAQNITLTHGNGLALGGAANKAGTPGDYMILRWAATLDLWEQVTALEAN